MPLAAALLAVAAAAAALTHGPVGLRSSLLAAIAPIETITPERLRSAYTAGGLNVLIVPGHDRDDYGAQFNGVREADLTSEAAGYLAEFLRRDGRINVFITRDPATGDYTPLFASYFVHQADEVLSFRARLVETMIGALRRGAFRTRRGVAHGSASPRVAAKLYAVNKLANDQRIDVVLHLHFNDYGGRPSGRKGEYAGFSIYAPDTQFSNARASSALAGAVFRRLKTERSVSTLPGERSGIIEDQELIALGANGSLDAAALLIEFGYIYEAPFTNAAVRRDALRSLAYQTYAGIREYLDPRAGLAPTALLPFPWSGPLSQSVEASREVLALQAALRHAGFYPPPGKDLAACPLTGVFGSCTAAAISRFQEAHAEHILRPLGLARGTGQAGLATLKKLQELYPLAESAASGKSSEIQ